MEKFPSSRNNILERASVPKVEVEPEFVEFAPQEFIDNPLEYFEREGKNVKSGEIKYDEAGIVREDPTAVKDLPTWRNAVGAEIKTVGRRVNTAKGAVGESGDPFHEYKILERLARLGLPAAKPIAKAEQAGMHVIVMERIPGVRWSERDSLRLKESGYSDDDIAALMTEAEHKMSELEARFDEAGVIRGWKLKDMVFEVDVPNKKILSIVPTDWERTKILEKE